MDKSGNYGLRYKKVDLHMHTPASDDYVDKKTTAEQIVKQALEIGLSVIAVTDHQTGDMVDAVKEASKGLPITIIPGVEILATGGKKGVHAIVLFDVDKSSKHVNQFLNKIGIFDKDGKKTPATELPVGKIADELLDYDNTAIIVLAHCNSSKGVSGDIAGEVRKLIFKPQRNNILGAETNESDFKNADKIKNHTRVVDLFDGNNGDFDNKFLGVFQSSDAHSLSEMGRKYSYFKIDDNVTLEDIRQCLIDPETRIRQSFEYSQSRFPHIDKLYIEGGFLDSQTAEFHEGLNSLLGAKGSGKSLIIEFLRFAFNLEPLIGPIADDHRLKLDNCLKLHGFVQVDFTDASGKKFSVKRTYNPAEGNPIEIVDMSDSTLQDFEIDKLFPVLFLSQNEIVEISQDKSGESQRNFIDRFFDFYVYQEQIESLNRDLFVIDKEFSEALKSHLSAGLLTKKISTYNAEILKLGRQIKNPVFEKYSKQANIGRAINNNIAFMDTVKESIESLNENTKILTGPKADDGEVDSAPAVKRVVDSVDAILSATTEDLAGLILKIDKEKQKISGEYDTWKTNFEPIKDEYEKVVAESGATQMKLNQRRSALINEVSGFEIELGKHTIRSQRLSDISSKRNKIIDKIDKAYDDYSNERKSRCEFFTKTSSNSLRVSIDEQSDKSAFQKNLLKLKKGSWLKDDEIEGISKLSPKDFVDSILRYEYTARIKTNLLKDIAKHSGLELSRIKTLADFLLDEYDYSKLLSLLYTSAPKDRPIIEYRVARRFKPLEELSSGQKATAMLMIALSDGEFPIVIDQPEDSLDLRSIWDDVCEKLRGGKDNRQFILTTHNSSVAVASDTDKFSILEAGATQGGIKNSGSMNNKEVAKEVMRYLEGGSKTYEKKRQKYLRVLNSTE